MESQSNGSHYKMLRSAINLTGALFVLFQAISCIRMLQFVGFRFELMAIFAGSLLCAFIAAGLAHALLDIADAHRRRR